MGSPVVFTRFPSGWTVEAESGIFRRRSQFAERQQSQIFELPLQIIIGMSSIFISARCNRIEDPFYDSNLSASDWHGYELVFKSHRRIEDAPSSVGR